MAIMAILAKVRQNWSAAFKGKQQLVRDEIALLDVHSWSMTDFP